MLMKATALQQNLPPLLSALNRWMSRQRWPLMDGRWWEAKQSHPLRWPGGTWRRPGSIPYLQDGDQGALFGMIFTPIQISSKVPISPHLNMISPFLSSTSITLRHTLLQVPSLIMPTAVFMVTLPPLFPFLPPLLLPLTIYFPLPLPLPGVETDVGLYPCIHIFICLSHLGLLGFIFSSRSKIRRRVFVFTSPISSYNTFLLFAY